MNKIYVIGIGYRPLDKRSKDIIYNSEVILANDRLLEVFKEYDEYENIKDRIKIINNVYETMEFIRKQITEQKAKTPNSERQTHNLTLLASGDPMFFGIGRMIVNEFGKDNVEILPDLSSVQTAFSRIKEPWSEAFFMSLHGGPDPAKRRKLEYEIRDIPKLLETHIKIAVLTDKINNPSEIAKVLTLSLVSRLSSLIMYVCERLGCPDEKITEGSPREIAEKSFSHPNVVIIINRKALGVMRNELKKKTDYASRVTHHNLKFGLREEEFQHTKGMITKDEVRAVTIHKLRFSQEGVFWDIGAGSGSISIEAARLYPELKVFAVERDEGEIKNINENRKRFKAANVETIKGEAPEALKDMPAPDRVFIGGSGGRIGEIISCVGARMSRGIMVINAVKLETLNEAVQALKEAGYITEVSEVAVSRSKIINGGKHIKALNPIFIITGEKT